MSQRLYLRTFGKAHKFIFKFLSLKISLIQANCHREQVRIVRSDRLHSLKKSLEGKSEGVSLSARLSTLTSAVKI